MKNATSKLVSAQPLLQAAEKSMKTMP